MNERQFNSFAFSFRMRWDFNSNLPIIFSIFNAAVPSPPTAPLEVRAIGVNTSIFEWGIPESDGGAPLEGYNIAIRDLKRTMWIEVGRVGADTQRFQIRDLQDDHEYLIRIFARNEVGLSEPLESDEPYKVLPMTGKHLHSDSFWRSSIHL